MPIPHPLFGPALGQLGRRLGVGGTYSDGVRLLRYGRGVDNTRLRDEVGFEPAFDAAAAVEDFAAKQRGWRVVRMPTRDDVSDLIASR
jgi:UDP-glucose 4-epimerase